MAEELPLEDSFSIDLQWPEKPGKGGNLLLDESLARFQILVGGKSITAYQTENGDTNSYLHVPAYYFVEWLSLNWWSFLYEPRKTDREDDYDFRSRHWIGMARNGFALPDVLFSPVGNNIDIAARPATLRFARLGFTESITTRIATENVRSEFSKFINQVLTRLKEKGIKDSEAHDAWAQVTMTSKEEEDYCRLIGSMGLSPYVEHPDVDRTIEEIQEKISQTMLLDLCEATSSGNVKAVAAVTHQASQSLARAKPVKVTELLKAEKPPDNSAHAYEWGYSSAATARQALGIAADDPSGATAFFDKLKLDVGIETTSEVANSTVISGAEERENEDMRLSIVGSNIPNRKFAAARAAFLAWSRAEKSSRLVTTARTRDQQASRAFAAELLVPEKYLHKKLGAKTEVSRSELDKLSEAMGVSPPVVHYQARNHGYYIAEAA